MVTSPSPKVDSLSLICGMFTALDERISIKMPPLKSIPKFNPREVKQKTDARRIIADNVKAKPRLLTNRMFVPAGTKRIGLSIINPIHSNR